MSAAVPVTEMHSGDLDRIRNLIPFRHLDDQQFKQIVLDASFNNLDSGQTLFDQQLVDNVIFYLLDGQLDISDQHDQTFCVTGGSIETLHPITMHPSARVKAIAKSNIHYVVFPKTVIDDVKHAQEPDFELKEIGSDDDQLSNQILFGVYHDLLGAELTLPVLPEVAFKIRRAAEDPDCGVDEIAKIIHSDPGTSAYCITIANSAAYARGIPVAEIREAVVRIGVEATRDVVTAYTLKNLFKASDPTLERFMRMTWQHSCQIAVGNFVLSKIVGNLNPERALLAGLVHEIGTTVVIASIAEQKPSSINEAMMCEVIRELSAPIGAMVLRSWQFPDAIVEVCLEPDTYNKPIDSQLTLCDVAALVHYHEHNPPIWGDARPNVEHLSAFEFFGADAFSDDGRLIQFQSAEQELNDITNILIG